MVRKWKSGSANKQGGQFQAKETTYINTSSRNEHPNYTNLFPTFTALFHLSVSR